jgi:N-acetylgalactosamine-6-sulfatase
MKERKKYLIAIVAILSVISFGLKKASVHETANRQAQPPNIVFIFADDWGYGDLGSHGSTFIKTPNLDKMAAEGTDFQNFSVSNPVCSPSRTAVMTGHFPARHSVHGHFASIELHEARNMPDWLNPKAPMLPRMLKEAGYATAHFGKWHLTNVHVKDAPSPLEYGYDEFDCFNVSPRFKQAPADSTIFRAIDFIERKKDQPFFVNVWIHATHTPHYPKDHFMKQYSELDEQQQVYASIATEADHRIGLLFKKLKELGIDGNTLVIFSSDNGPEITGNRKVIPDASTGKGLGTYYSVGETGGLKGRKRSLFAGGVRLPFIVRWPGVVPEGRVDRTTALAAVDLVPTFVELAGAKFPKGYQADGVSIVKALKGESFDRTKPIYWQWHFPSAKNEFWPATAIQSGNWKLLMNHETGDKELYDIQNDWAEQRNVAGQYPDKVKILSDQINKWVAELPETPPADCFSKYRSE